MSEAIDNAPKCSCCEKPAVYGWYTTPLCFEHWHQRNPDDALRADRMMRARFGRGYTDASADLDASREQLTFPDVCKRLGFGYPLPDPLTPEGEAWINKQLG